MLKKMRRVGLLLLISSSVSAHLYVFNDTQKTLWVRVEPKGTTQYTKNCSDQSFELRPQSKYQLSDVQGAYPCPDVSISIKGETDPNPSEYFVKVKEYDFEGSLGNPPLQDVTTIYIVSQEEGDKFYEIRVVNQPPKEGDHYE